VRVCVFGCVCVCVGGWVGGWVGASSFKRCVAHEAGSLKPPSTTCRPRKSCCRPCSSSLPTSRRTKICLTPCPLVRGWLFGVEHLVMRVFVWCFASCPHDGVALMTVRADPFDGNSSAAFRSQAQVKGKPGACADCCALSIVHCPLCLACFHVTLTAVTVALVVRMWALVSPFPPPSFSFVRSPCGAALVTVHLPQCQLGVLPAAGQREPVSRCA